MMSPLQREKRASCGALGNRDLARNAFLYDCFANAEAVHDGVAVDLALLDIKAFALAPPAGLC